MKEKIKDFIDHFDAHDFLKVFVPALVIITLLLIPVHYGLDRLGGIRLFSGTDVLMKELNYIVDPQSPFYKEFADSKRLNVMLVGVNGGLTDVIMVASVDAENQKVDLISVPRDTFYDRKGSGGSDKINAVYEDEGITGLAKAVSDMLLGMPINYYAVVDYQGIKTIVDTMGGVPVDVEFHMHYEDPKATPPLYIDIPAGQQVLDGEHAVQYIRFRKGSGGSQGYAEGDIGRIGTQQKFMKAAFARALDYGIVKTAKVVSANVDSDITLKFAVKLGRFALGMDPEDLTTYVLPGNSGMIGGLSFWHADTEQTKKMIYEIYDNASSADGSADSDE